jgi:hypothetical protein
MVSEQNNCPGLAVTKTASKVVGASILCKMILKSHACTTVCVIIIGSLYFHAPCRLSKLFPAKRYRAAFAHQICMYQRDNPLVPKFLRDIEMIYYYVYIAEFSKKSITRVVTLLIVPTSITKANYT